MFQELQEFELPESGDGEVHVICIKGRTDRWELHSMVTK
jgi:hypothetical protein